MTEFVNSPVSVTYENYSTTTNTPITTQKSYFQISFRAMFMVVIYLCSLVGNALVFVVFYRKQHWLFTISNRFLLNLALTNFLMALFIMPFVLISTITEMWVFGQAWCQITALLSTLLLAACILTLLLISLDRYFAVVTPLRYNARMTPSRSNYALAIVWVLSVLLSIPPIFGWNRFSYQKEKHSCTVFWKTLRSVDRSYTVFYSVAAFYLPFVLIVWIYCSILRVSQVTSARVRRNSILPDVHVSNCEPVLVTSSNRERRHSSLSRRGSAVSFGRIGLFFQKDEWKTAKTSLLVISAVAFSWLPYFVLITLESTLRDPSRIPVGVQTTAVWMALAGCAINPFVYFYRNSNIRQQIPKLFHKLRPTYDSELDNSRPRTFRRLSESMVSYYLNRRRSSISTTGTGITRLSSSTSLHSEENSASQTGSSATGWFPEGYFFQRRRSLDSILATTNRHVTAESNRTTQSPPSGQEVFHIAILQHSPRRQVIANNDTSPALEELSFELPGEVPREPTSTISSQRT